MRKREHLIFARDRWEIATVETNRVTGKPQWVRRDSSYICDVGDEVERQDMPTKPTKRGQR
jgi:hypothetical protein